MRDHFEEWAVRLTKLHLGTWDDGTYVSEPTRIAYAAFIAGAYTQLASFPHKLEGEDVKIDDDRLHWTPHE